MECKKMPEECRSIEEIRNEIDKIDKEIIRLFRSRDGLVKEIVKYKSDEEGIIARERKDFVIKQRGQWAEKHGLNPKLFRKIYTLLIDNNIKKELEIFKSKTIKSE